MPEVSIISPAHVLRLVMCLVLRLIDVLRVGGLVLGDEVVLRVSGQPVRDLGHLLSQAVDRLLIHVGLGHELGERD